MNLGLNDILDHKIFNVQMKATWREVEGVLYNMFDNICPFIMLSTGDQAPRDILNSQAYISHLRNTCASFVYKFDAL